jgi:hypothetical protein
LTIQVTKKRSSGAADAGDHLVADTSPEEQQSDQRKTVGVDCHEQGQALT